MFSMKAFVLLGSVALMQAAMLRTGVTISPEELAKLANETETVSTPPSVVETTTLTVPRHSGHQQQASPSPAGHHHHHHHQPQSPTANLPRPQGNPLDQVVSTFGAFGNQARQGAEQVGTRVRQDAAQVADHVHQGVGRFGSTLRDFTQTGTGRAQAGQ